MIDLFTEGLRCYLPDEFLAKTAAVTIGIAGCGGVGSNCAHNLVRCGFQRFLLVDDDQVEASNLNRQFFSLHQVGRPKAVMLRDNLVTINPHLVIETLIERITADSINHIFRNCDVIVEAFDEAAAKKMLVEKCLLPDRLVVAVSGVAGCGAVDAIITRKINTNFYLVGDFTSEVSDTLHPYAPGVAIAAAKQADIILSHYLHSGESTCKTA